MGNRLCGFCRGIGNCAKNGQAQSDESEPPPSEQIYESEMHYRHESHVILYYPFPNEGKSVSKMTEEEQIKIVERIGLIQNLPSGIFDDSVKCLECVICMIEFTTGDHIRFLPCMHFYHLKCIDDWLMRSFTCPVCIDPVEVALFNYESETDYDRK